MSAFKEWMARNRQFFFVLIALAIIISFFAIWRSPKPASIDNDPPPVPMRSP